MIISSSAFISLLFGILIYINENYKSKLIIFLIITSIILMSLSNIFIIIAFYQSDTLIQTNNCYCIPLITYVLGMIFFIFSGIYLFYGKYAKTIS